MGFTVLTMVILFTLANLIHWWVTWDPTVAVFETLPITDCVKPKVESNITQLITSPATVNTLQHDHNVNYVILNSQFWSNIVNTATWPNHAVHNLPLPGWHWLFQ